MALGVRSTAQKIERRRKALVEEAIELELIFPGQEDRIQVLDANSLARWATEFPSLAASQVLSGLTQGVQDFEKWSRSSRHQTQWVDSAERSALIDQIRTTLIDPSGKELRIQGVSGIGKTRLVMEAVRTTTLRPLVAYVPDERAMSSDTLAHVIADDRSAVLIVDDCPGRAHEKLAEQIPFDARVKLVTIGEPDGYSVRSPTLELAELPDEGVEGFLTGNFPHLFAEARRFIVEHCNGNARFATILAERIEEVGEAHAADLIGRNDIEQFAQVLLPVGRSFFLATVVALLERIGWERELRPQLEALADFADATLDEFDALARDLEERGVLIRQGRYRAVTPHPLAVVLAASAWRDLGPRIIDDLVPTLDREMAVSVFRRVADLGSYEPARKVLRRLLEPGEMFGSLESIEENSLGEFVIQIAIIAPDETAEHLSRLINTATLEALRTQTHSRRDLVWALEKLAWHSRTFEIAADMMLRLALAENETYANNATGTWMSLFGAGLPATAAMPTERIGYLDSRSRSEDADTRLLVARACHGVMHPHESVVVSGERQGGRLVEPRGSVRTYQEAFDYRISLIAILSRLAIDDDNRVAEEAVGGVTGAIHAWIDNPIVKGPLVDALLSLPPEHIRRVRREVEHLRALYRDLDDRRDVAAAIDELAAQLPPAPLMEQLRGLLTLHPWDIERRDEIRNRVGELVTELIDEDQLVDVLSLLDEDLAGAWFLGRALAEKRVTDINVIRALADREELNLAAVGGYLQGLVEDGEADAFDVFLDENDTLSDATKLSLAVRGPLTDRARERVFALLARLPVCEGARALFGWQRNVDERGLRDLLSLWQPRVASQDDYNALIDWLGMTVHIQNTIPDRLRDDVLDLLERRLEYPAIANESFDWARLAQMYIDDRPLELARLILDLISQDKGLFHRSDDEARLLIGATAKDSARVWEEVGTRLEGGDWRIAMTLRGWFSHSIPAEVVQNWVGDSVDRARLAAEVASTGSSEPTPIARFLLEVFGNDEEVQSALAGEFFSGSWTGPESQRLPGMIEQLSGWLVDDMPNLVKEFALKLRASLERDRDRALEREAERGW